MQYSPPPLQDDKSMNKKLGFIVILILIIAGIFGTYFSYVSNMKPPSYEKIEVLGIDGEIQIYKDTYGVPHILATTDKDMLFAEGFMHAQDRLWQLELTRSIINGETSRFAGEQNINVDKFLKSLQITEMANYTWTNYVNSQTQHLIKSYVRGINFYIATHNHSLPIEFTLTGITPKNWTVIDVMSMGSYMALSLSLGNAYQELLRRDILQATGGNLALTEALLPIDHPDARNYFLSLNQSDIIYKPSTDEGENTQNNQQKNALNDIKQFFHYDESVGSNNWVVGSNRSSYDYPILANDMHLGLTTPGVWYEIHMKSPNYNLWGFSIPGAPFIVAGHNEYVAWGFTNTEADVLDLYYLKETPDGTGYYVGNETKPFELREETIPVKGLDNESITFTVKISEFGPIVNFGDEKFALQWTLYAKTPRNNIINAFHGMNAAQSADDLIRAMEYFSLPGQNVVFADVYGTFGYQYTGLTPIRKTGYGLIPMNASTGKYGWTGYLGYKDQYAIINPIQGYFATANANHFPANYTPYITDRFLPPYRYERINELLDTMNNATVTDMMQIQKDTYYIPAKTILPVILNTIDTQNMDSLQNETYTYLSKWDYNMSVNTVGGLIYQAIYMFMIKNTFLDEFGADLIERYSYKAIFGMEYLITRPNHPLFDNKNTPEVESVTDVIQQSFQDAITYLSNLFGNNVHGWRWGRIHYAVFYHAIGKTGLTGNLNNGPIETGGSYYTVNAGSSPQWRLDENNELTIDWEQKAGSSERLIVVVDPSWENLYVTVPPGQSGNLGSTHYSDQLKDWAEFKYHQTIFDMQTITSKLTPSVVLIPKP